jgi:hypothetical protein
MTWGEMNASSDVKSGADVEARGDVEERRFSAASAEVERNGLLAPVDGFPCAATEGDHRG